MNAPGPYSYYQGNASDGKPDFALVNNRWPAGSDEQELQFHRLLVTAKPGTDMDPIYFNPTWGPDRIDAFVRELFPNLFAYLDARYGTKRGPHRDELHYGLVQCLQRNCVLVRKQSPLSGADLELAKAAYNRNTVRSRLCFGE